MVYTKIIFYRAYTSNYFIYLKLNIQPMIRAIIIDDEEKSRVTLSRQYNLLRKNLFFSPDNAEIDPVGIS